MDTEQLAERLTSWIEEMVSRGNSKGALVAMSGGLDSSVVAVLCKRTFPDNTLGLIMPCHSHPQDAEHAQMVASQFSINTTTILLDGIFDTFTKVLPDNGTDTESHRLALANLKARLRMLTLYYFCNRWQYMVVGSSNRSQLAIGYFTKYGDAGIDILPIGQLVKRQVVELARFLDIPQVIIDKPPSAGLWPGQTDEGDMGFSYQELDNYLLTGQVNDEIKSKIETMMVTAEHKRTPPPSPVL